MMFNNKLAAIIIAVPLALAAPWNPKAITHTAGEVTYFAPGLGACGQTHGESAFITAISASLFDSEDFCGKAIKVTGPAGTVTVTVVDRCGGCAHNDLDLSPAAFEASIGGLSIGRTTAEWEWA